MEVRRNLIANLLGQGWSAVLNIGAMPIYIALLGMESFGLIGLATVVLTLTILLDGGIATTLNRAMVRYRAGQAALGESADLLRSFEGAILAAASFIACVALLFGPALAAAWLDPGGLPPELVETALVLMVQIAVLRVTEAIYRAALLGLDRPVTMNALSAVFTSLRILGPVPLILWGGGDVLTFFWGQLAASGASLLCFAAATHLVLEGSILGRGRFNWAALRSSLGFTGAAFAIAALVALINQVDKLLVARLVSLEMLGYYSAATVAATGIYQLVQPVFQSFYPKLSYFHTTGDGVAFDRLFLRTAATMGFIAGVPIAIIALNVDEVLFAWTGDTDVVAQAGPLLAWLCLGTLANGLFHAPLAALLASARHGIAVVTTTVLLVLLVPALLLGWSYAGLMGLAAAWSVALAVWFLATLVLTATRVTTGQIGLEVLGASLIPCAVALLISLALRTMLEIEMAQQLRTALVVIAFGAAVTLMTAAVLWLSGRAITRLRQVPA